MTCIQPPYSLAEWNRRLEEERALARTPLSSEQLARVTEFLLELETDLHVLATAASTMADREEEPLKRSESRVLYGSLSIIVTLGVYLTTIDLTASLFVPSIWLTMGSISLLILIISRLINLHEVNRLRKISSDYLIQANLAARARVYTIPTSCLLSVADKQIEELCWAKRSIDQNFCPPVQEIEKARLSVRSQVLENMEVDKLLQLGDAQVPLSITEEPTEPGVPSKKRLLG